MKAHLKHRLTELEARIPTPRVSLDELVERVQALYPNEAELLEAIDNCRRLESLDTKEATDEYRDNLRFITLEIRRLETKEDQPSK